MKNIYLLIVLANACLTFGNAFQGRKLSHVNMATMVLLIFGAKFAVGIFSYATDRTASLSLISAKEIGLLIGVGLLLGVGEMLLFKALGQNTNLVAAMGCLYPILLATFAWLLTGDAPKPMMVGAIVVSGIAIYMAYVASST